jgi:nucleoid-associated protein EbfC
MFGKFGDMMGKLQEMKQKADEIKKKLENTVITSETGGIRIEINGNRKIKSVEITDALLKENKDKLMDKIRDAFNNAISQAEQANEDEMKKVAGSMLPGL